MTPQATSSKQQRRRRRRQAKKQKGGGDANSNQIKNEVVDNPPGIQEGDKRIGSIPNDILQREKEKRMNCIEHEKEIHEFEESFGEEYVEDAFLTSMDEIEIDQEQGSFSTKRIETMIEDENFGDNSEDRNDQLLNNENLDRNIIKDESNNKETKHIQNVIVVSKDSGLSTSGEEMKEEGHIEGRNNGSIDPNLDNFSLKDNLQRDYTSYDISKGVSFLDKEIQELLWPSDKSKMNELKSMDIGRSIATVRVALSQLKNQISHFKGNFREELQEIIQEVKQREAELNNLIIAHTDQLHKYLDLRSLIDSKKKSEQEMKEKLKEYCDKHEAKKMK